jgi:hypothetical protein
MVDFPTPEAIVLPFRVLKFFVFCPHRTCVGIPMIIRHATRLPDLSTHVIITHDNDTLLR